MYVKRQALSREICGCSPSPTPLPVGEEAGTPQASIAGITAAGPRHHEARLGRNPDKPLMPGILAFSGLAENSSSHLSFKRKKMEAFREVELTSGTALHSKLDTGRIPFPRSLDCYVAVSRWEPRSFKNLLYCLSFALGKPAQADKGRYPSRRWAMEGVGIFVPMESVPCVNLSHRPPSSLSEHPFRDPKVLLCALYIFICLRAR